jgi:hypothetical protein
MRDSLGGCPSFGRLTEPEQDDATAPLEGYLTRPTDHLSTLLSGASMFRVRLLVERCALAALFSCLLFALAASGCTSHWGWRPLDQPTPLKRDNLVWIWSRGTVNKWQAVTYTKDSVSGIPYEMSVKCDSCRLSLPLTQVDSMRLGYRYDSFAPKYVLEGAGVIAAALIIEVVVCSSMSARC